MIHIQKATCKKCKKVIKIETDMGKFKCPFCESVMKVKTAGAKSTAVDIGGKK